MRQNVSEYAISRKKYKKLTRNSSVDEIGERYSLKHAIVVKLYLPYTQFSRNVRLPHQ